MVAATGLILPFKPRTDTKVEVVTSDGRSGEVVVPWWIITPDRLEEILRIEQSTFFLVRQGELGEIARCKECGSKHTHFTLKCVERPFDSREKGLHAYWYHAGKYGTENFLSQVELERYHAIDRHLRKSSQRDLSSSHPELSKKLGTQDNDFDVGSVSLGILDPITKEKAEALAWNINAKGVKPPFRLKGLER